LSFPGLLYQFFIAPLELLFEFIYSYAYSIIGNIGLSIIPLSLAVNFLLLPFYDRAEQIQKEEHARAEKMAPGIAHLKKTFSGDKRFMILQTYYRQNHYSPLYALRSSFALFLEIPFFIAAYHFLSNYTLLTGAKLGPLTSLGKPDELLTIAGFSINILPILMTVINIISSSIFAKGYSFGEKFRMYILAFVFLVLLYRSPSGLVFYWTLNQVFSLVKNLINASKNRRKALDITFSLLSLTVLLYALVFFKGSSQNKLIILVFAIVLIIPVLLARSTFFKKSTSSPGKELANIPTTKIFLFSALFMAVATGLLLPSMIIGSSPSEFVIFEECHSPVRYIVMSFVMALGFFVLWCGMFYYLSTEKTRRKFAAVLCFLSLSGITGYLFFGKNLPFLSESLVFDGGLRYPLQDMLLNLLAVFLIIALITLIWKKRATMLSFMMLVLVIGGAGISGFYIHRINNTIPHVKETIERERNKQVSFPLSRNGKNVVVIMMDRAMSCYIPYLFNEDPHLVEQFDGFTYYPNTLSFGATTNIGTPALFGGYEYQPKNMNARDDLSLEEKQNEALRVMPVLFDDAGYNVTVCEPPYAGYKMPSDLSIYDDHPDIKAYLAEYGQFWSDPRATSCKKNIWKRNFFCYSFMRMLPLISQNSLYDSGFYHDPNWLMNTIYSTQYRTGDHTAIGEYASFMNAYSFLKAVPDITTISDSSENHFLMFANHTAHNITMLQEPEYVPDLRVNNTEYDLAHEDRFTVNGRTITMGGGFELASYQCNMAALRELGKWFDYLRAEGIYDNTRIILVSDHGFMNEHFEDLLIGNHYEGKFPFNCENIIAYNALLMVKDFGSTGFTTDNTFMTNADTPVLAFEDLIQDPVNPATGNPINSNGKFADKLHVMYTDDWRPMTNNGNRYSPGVWFGVSNQDIFDPKNWEDEGIE